MDEKGINPWSDVLDETRYRELFGYEKHPFSIHAEFGPAVLGDGVDGGVVALGAGHHGLGDGHDIPVLEGK